MIITKPEKTEKVERIKNLSKNELEEKIITPYEEGKIIFVNGTSINSCEIYRIHIRKTSETYEQISQKLYQEEAIARRNSASRGVLDITPYRNYENAFWKGEDVLGNFILGPPGYKIMKEIKLNKENHTDINKVFIVHGHSEEMKQSVARFIEKLGLEPIILHEHPNKGRTIIEKFSDYADVGYAIILLSADDLGYAVKANPNSAKHRARQNVILELGYFLGKLGRDKVAALFEKNKDIEIPSDFNGVLYIGYSDDDSWKFSIAKELKATGFNIDLNKII